MKIEHRIKPKISTEFKMDDGSVGTRSKMQDFETLRNRIITRLINQLGEKEANLIILPGINAYNSAKYDEALSHFTNAIEKNTAIAEEIRPHIHICKRVLSVNRTTDDIAYLDIFKKWEKLPRLFKYFRKAPVFKIRCKYCGHYTKYIHPEKGFAYFDENNCELCNRGYPVPDFAWDGVDGKAYIYYRHSVTESEFYKEFEEEYDANPDHTSFLKKK